MAKFHRTKILKIDKQPIFSDIHATSASVWNECLSLMEFYQYQRGYPHAHNHFYFGKDCEGWMDKNLSKSQPLHSQSIQAIRKQYFKSWKSYSALKKSDGSAKPKPPNKRKNYMTTRWLKSAITIVICFHLAVNLVGSFGQSHSVLKKVGFRVFFSDPVRLENCTIGVNLGIFRCIYRNIPTNAAPTGLSSVR